MTDDDITRVFAGPPSDPARQELHDKLDALLDSADAETGVVDPARYWGFVSSVAAGRGIAEDLELSAAELVTAAPNTPTEYSETWRRLHWAVVYKLLLRLSAADHEHAVLPDWFSRPALEAIALNLAAGGKGDNPDLFELGTQRGGSHRGPARVARVLLVKTVVLRAARDGRSEDSVRAELFPKYLDGRTWEDWKRDAARGPGVTVDGLRRELRRSVHSESPEDVGLSDAQVASLFRIAFQPR